MKMKNFLPLIFLACIGCSQEDISAAGTKVGKAYNESSKDKNVKNWQNRVADSEHCAPFKARFNEAGSRYEAMNGSYMNDMQAIFAEVKKSNCENKP